MITDWRRCSAAVDRTPAAGPEKPGIAEQCFNLLTCRSAVRRLGGRRLSGKAIPRSPASSVQGQMALFDQPLRCSLIMLRLEPLTLSPLPSWKGCVSRNTTTYRAAVFNLLPSRQYPNHPASTPENGLFHGLGGFPQKYLVISNVYYHSSNPTRSATAHLPFIVGTELSREQPEERHALDGFGPPGEVRRFGSGKTDYRSQTAAVLLSSASAAAHPSAARPPAPVGTMPPLGPSTIHDGRGPVGARSTRAILPSENFWIGPPLAVACARFRTGRAPTPRMS